MMGALVNLSDLASTSADGLVKCRSNRLQFGRVIAPSQPSVLSYVTPRLKNASDKNGAESLRPEPFGVHGRGRKD
jgi:hypothetical protein